MQQAGTNMVIAGHQRIKAAQEAGLKTVPVLFVSMDDMAAEQTGRRCYGMEIEPKYCDVIIKRWETFTNQKAERVK